MKLVTAPISQLSDVAMFPVVDAGSLLKRATPAQVRSLLGSAGEMVARDFAINGIMLETDPVTAVISDTKQPGSATGECSRVIAPVSGTITKCWVIVTGTAGSGLTGSGATGVGLYDASWNRLAWADCSTSWQGTGIISTSLQASFALVAGTEYRIVLVAAGTTRPNFRGAGQSFAINVNTSGEPRSGTRNSVTLSNPQASGWTASTAARIWVGFSA